MNVYNKSLTQCGEASLPGIQEVIVTSRSGLGQFWFYQETDTKQSGKIIGNTDLSATWYRIVSNREFTTFNQTQTNDIARLYQMTLDLRFVKMNVIKRDVIEQMQVANDLVVIFRDKYGAYWLMGETQGCKLSTWNLTSGNNTGSNETVIQFSCTERYPIRQVDINIADIELLAICNLTWAEYCALNWTDLCNDYSWN